MKPLEALLSDEFIELAAPVGTAEALHLLLRRRPEVEAVRRAFQEGGINETTLRDFVQRLVRGFVPGERFGSEFALAAIAVVLETVPGSFAESFLTQLSESRFAELPMSSRVGALALRERRRLLAQTTVRNFDLEKSPPLYFAMAFQPPGGSTVQSDFHEMLA